MLSMNQLPPRRPTHLSASYAMTRRRKLALVMVCLITAAGLTYLKEQSNREQAVINATAAAEKQRVAEQLTKINEALPITYQGESTNAEQQALVAKIGEAFNEKTEAKKRATPLKFHLLAEPNAINLFALPSGDVYITTALVNRMKTEGELAAVIAHGVAHALAGDMPEAAFNENETLSSIGYTLEQEYAADMRAIELMADAGYDPNAMLSMFTVLLSAYSAGADVAFFATHPNDENRLESIRAALLKRYPDGIPKVLSQ